MIRSVFLGLVGTLLLSGEAWAVRSWVLTIDHREGDGWVQEPTGGYNPATGEGDAPYYWGRGWDPVRRAYWRFDGGDIPEEPRLYTIETWAPPAHNNVYSVVEVKFREPEVWPIDETIPWTGQSGQNKQWVQRKLGAPGAWGQTGPGPQAPLGPACTYPFNEQGTLVWLRRGSQLYVKFDFGYINATSEIAVSAIRITEAFSTPSCGGAVARGPLDLRCVGNADPLYQPGEYCLDRAEKTVDGTALGTTAYAPKCFPSPLTPSPGLPVDGVYTAHLPSGDITFNLFYRGMQSIKWNNDAVGSPFSKYNVYTLNPTGEREFVPGHYGKLYLLSTKSGGNGGTLNVLLRYSDGSSQLVQANLYDWFDQNGDATSVAVGENGVMRSAGARGFQRFATGNGVIGDGGDTHGAFLFVHAVSVDGGRELSQVELSVSADSFSGTLVLMGASLPGCSKPVFDVVGGGPGGWEPDGAVDQKDFGILQACFTDLFELADPIKCGCLDVTGDGFITLEEFGYFEACKTEPASGTVAPAGCDQPAQ